MKLFEEFKLYENLFEDAAAGNEYPWMKDVPLVYPELYIDSDPDDPESDILIKYTYLAGPEDVAEVLDSLITEEDVAGTEYDLHTIKTDNDAWYAFLNSNFDILVNKYDEELLSAFEDRAVKAAISEAEDDYYYGNSEYLHESSEDNMARMRRQIRAEIAKLEAEKAADTDPTSAYYYDEKIKACWAELRELGIIAPTPATAKKRAIKAEQEEKAKEISRFLKYAFMGLSKYFGIRPRCEALKDGDLIIVFKKGLTPAAAAEAIDICAKVGIPIKHKENSSSGSVFEVDAGNLSMQGSPSFNDIDTDAIKARLKAEHNNNVSEEFKLYETMWN